MTASGFCLRPGNRRADAARVTLGECPQWGPIGPVPCGRHGVSGRTERSGAAGDSKRRTRPSLRDRAASSRHHEGTTKQRSAACLRAGRDDGRLRPPLIALLRGPRELRSRCEEHLRHAASRICECRFVAVHRKG